jgi:amino acid transporter
MLFECVTFTFMLHALKPARRQLRLLPLIAATYFMVSGGPYGIEDILGGAGYARAILILLALPLIWSLPTALMIGELAAALPAEGGFYVWVRRGLGPFWGYQEGWLSLSASIFDMALYPSIFALYLGRFNPALTVGHREYFLKLAVVVLCCVWNLFGASEVGQDSVGLFALLLLPFAVFTILGLWHGITLHPAIRWGHTAATGSDASLSTAILVAMWNYMGWDNASTVATEVENPQHNYPRAMLWSAILTAITYILPLTAMALAGLSPDGFTTGSWTIAGEALGGPLLATAVIAGGVICGVGMFNALMLSYTRLPAAMAKDSLLPGALRCRNSRGVPWVSVIVCGAGWALALNLPFERLISIDLILYGTSLLLEFAALIALRIREPRITRPFRAGNFVFACLLGAGPAALITYALIISRDEKLGAAGSAFANVSALAFASAIGLLGLPLYALSSAALRRTQCAPVSASAPE